MVLAAICPHCQTMFRVASDQLKLRGGIVRCGACHEVFDGNAALVDLDAIPVQAPPSALPAGELRQTTDSSLADHAAAMPADAFPEAADVAPLNAEPGGDSHADTDADIGALPVLNSVVQDRRDSSDVEHAGQPAAAGFDDAAPDGSLEALAEADSGNAPPAAATVDTPAPADPPTPDPAPGSDADTDTIDYILDFDTTLTDTPGVQTSYDDAVRDLETGAAPADAEEHLVALPPPPDSDHVGEDAGAIAQYGDAPEPSPLEQARIETPARQPAGAVDSLAPLLMRASAAAEDRPGTPSVLPAGQQAQARARRARAAAERKQAPAAAPEVAAPPEPAPDDEPEFVRRGRQREASGERTRMLFIGAIAVLALVLLVQGVWTFKNTLAARYPGARPVLGGLCAVMGCKVELPAQIDALSVETGELQTLDASTFSLATLLRNQGDLVQTWPHLELALTDANDKTLVKRVFAPADYLPAGTQASRGFAARSEQAVKLTFQLDQIKASGYHLAIFYP